MLGDVPTFILLFSAVQAKKTTWCFLFRLLPSLRHLLLLLDSEADRKMTQFVVVRRVLGGTWGKVVFSHRSKEERKTDNSVGKELLWLWRKHTGYCEILKTWLICFCYWWRKEYHHYQVHYHKESRKTSLFLHYKSFHLLKKLWPVESKTHSKRNHLQI